MLDLPRLGAIAFLIIWALCAANHYKSELHMPSYQRDSIMYCVVVGLGQTILLSVLFAVIILVGYIAAGGFSQ